MSRQYAITVIAVVFFFTTIVFVCGIKTKAVAAEPARLFINSVEAYQNGDYETARDGFEQIAAQGLINGELYYNLGNTYFKLGDLGRSIWWYERALKLMPGDPDIRFNLDYARTFVTDTSDTDSSPLYEIFFFWKDLIPRSLLAGAALTFNLLFWILLTWRIIRSKRPVKWPGWTLLSLSVILFICVTYDHFAATRENAAIILPAEVVVRSGLSDDSAELFRLHAGTRVAVEDTRNNYIKIAFSGDKIGWLPIASLGRI